MKTLKHIAILFLILLNFSCAHAQQTEQQLVVGTWVDVENPNVKMVFLSNGVQNWYTYGELFESNYWQINSSQTPSGLTISHLTLTNIQDSSDKSVFEIDGIDETEMGLIPQVSGRGPVQHSLFIKQ